MADDPKKLDGRDRFHWSADQCPSSFHCTVVNDDQLKLTYLVGQNDLSARPNMSLIGRLTRLDMLNILAKNRPEPRKHMVGQWNCSF